MGENDKKFIKGKILRKKIVHSEQPRKKFLHRPSEVFHRNLSNAYQRADWSKKTPVVKNMPSFLASARSECLFKTTF